jgi:hypothetical protein
MLLAFISPPVLANEFLFVVAQDQSGSVEKRFMQSVMRSIHVNLTPNHLLHWFLWSGGVGGVRWSDVVIPENSPALNQLIETIPGPGGPTYTGAALDAALSVISAKEAMTCRSSILIITDGDAPDDPGVYQGALKTAKNHDVRVGYVLVRPGPIEHILPLHALEATSPGWLHVSSTESVDEVTWRKFLSWLAEDRCPVG